MDVTEPGKDEKINIVIPSTRRLELWLGKIRFGTHNLRPYSCLTLGMTADMRSERELTFI
jgi:hypothetical protein